MNRVIGLILALCLALSLSGCAESVGETVDSILDDLEQVRSEIAAQEGGAEPERIEVQIQSGMVSFSEGTEYVEAGELAGDWVNTENGNILHVSENGEISMTDSEGRDVELEDAEAYQVVEKDGMIRLKGGDGEYVRVEDESLASQQVNYLALGETAKTDTVELTMTSIEFGEKISLQPGDYLLPAPDGTMVADDGFLFACVSFRAKNVSGGSISCGDVCRLELEYDNRDLYSWYQYADASGALPNLSPGDRVNCNGVIECATMVAQDDDTALCIHVTLPSSEGPVTYTYVLK